MPSPRAKQRCFQRSRGACAFPSVTRRQEQRDEYGRTVAEVRGFLAHANSVLLGVRIADGQVTYLELPRGVVLNAIHVHTAEDPMPCEWQPTNKILVIGSYTAIAFAAMEPR